MWMTLKSKVRADHLKNLTETLQLYLVVLNGALSSVLIREAENQPMPIYYVSRVLHGAEENYPILDKFVFALVISTRKLKIYFKSHPIQVVTDQPMKRVIASSQLSGRLTTWAIELSEFDISYVPRTSIKGQALADFIIECTTQTPQVVSGSSNFERGANNPDWTLFVDGARNEKGSGAGILIRGPDNISMEYALRFSFPTTNNEAEYEVMVVGLTIAKSLGIKCTWVKGDSKLIMDQVKGIYGVKHESMVKYHAKAIQLGKEFVQVGIDLVSNLPKAKGSLAVDYFSKWVEAEPLKKTGSDSIVRFLWKHVITRFGVPCILVSDNGPQFESEELAKICEKYKIEHRFSPVYYPQCNGQVKSLRTTPSHATGETPFNLVYGLKAVLPAEAGLPTYRQIGFSEEENDHKTREQLNLVDELRHRALYRMQDKDKLSLKWEGPYRVSRVLSPGTYELERTNGETIFCTWHASNLAKYYV
ncbi:hypothetical protein LIER_15505 [Lithospermum erythrorhizon]|uniref:Integrase catalytic domain-containing protein n=1 Tax=Lithospermum erythrorhizon TaxID=34254 RepID=A0AAV3Q355_LITER